MSVQAMTWVFEKSRHKGSAFVVMLTIANYAHKDGSNAFPGLETIARDSRITIRQVTRIIPVLERSGELLVQRSAGPHGTNRYTINMAQLTFSGLDKMSNGKTRSSNVQRSVRNQKIEPTPPLPPAEAGEQIFTWYGETIAVKTGSRRRLFTKDEWHSKTGLAACYLVEQLRAKGFEARLVPPEARTA